MLPRPGVLHSVDRLPSTAFALVFAPSSPEELIAVAVWNV
jgi:hypothetical protein